MKITVCLLAALGAILLVAALPTHFTAPTRTGAQAVAPLLQRPVQMGSPCRLMIVAGPDTIFDRGLLEKADDLTIVAGSFRYWEEPAGTVLYVYDNVQNLVGRVLNPGSVRILGRPETVTRAHAPQEGGARSR